MKFPRRQFLRIVAGTAALPAVSRKAWSQTYPVKPVRLIVGAAAGATTDIVAHHGRNGLLQSGAVVHTWTYKLEKAV